MSDKIIVWSDLTSKQREKILEDHRRWMVSNGGQRADLQGAYLQRAYLQGADLQGAYLQGAYLQGAYLQRADLQGAYLQRADLRGADLRGADLQGAYLQRADLQGAYLQGAYLQGADLQGAYLQGADLQGALLKDGLKILRIYQCGPQGSRGGYLVSYLCDDGKVYFSTGCQRAVEQKEFLKLVTEMHDGNRHGTEYKATVAHCVKMLRLAEKA